MRFRAFRVDWDTLFFFENVRELCAMREARNGSKGVKKFFGIFTRFRAFWVDWDTLFFFENFREREARNAASEASEMRAQSAKPEVAKRPSSPAGLAGRSASRACKLVYCQNKTYTWTNGSHFLCFLPSYDQSFFACCVDSLSDTLFFAWSWRLLWVKCWNNHNERTMLTYLMVKIT